MKIKLLKKLRKRFVINSVASKSHIVLDLHTSSEGKEYKTLRGARNFLRKKILEAGYEFYKNKRR